MRQQLVRAVERARFRFEAEDKRKNTAACLEAYGELMAAVAALRRYDINTGRRAA
jgi:hypothetical protein